MPLVTFLSDFGWHDHYIAAVKAKILTEDQNIKIVDISHNINKFDIIHAAYILKSVYNDFPEGTIHLVAVNLRSEANEELIVTVIKKHIFLCSNNGLLSLIDEENPAALYKILTTENDSNFISKDVLAAVAARLATGEAIEKLTEPMAENDFKRYMPLRVKANREIIQGHVIHVDGYGNLITNILKSDYDLLSKDKNVLIKFRNYGLPKVLDHYYDTKGGEAFAIFNAEGVLEIGIKQGNASLLLGLEYGSMVSIKFDDY